MRLGIVGGGSRGLGEAVFRGLKQRGWMVRELSRSAPHSGSVGCDFADPRSVEAGVRRVVEEVRGEELDEILVVDNAASLEPIGPLASLTAPEIQTHWNANVVGPSVLLARCIEAFQESPIPKVVVHVTSGAAIKSYPGWSMYGGSKAAMEHIVRTSAMEQMGLAHPFLLGSFDPGVMDTRMQDTIRNCSVDRFPSLARFQDLKASGGLRDPAVVAEALLGWAASGFQAGSRMSVQEWLAGSPTAA